MEKHVKLISNKYDILRFHCIIHQETLRAKSAVFGEVVKVVVKAVNLILSRALNQRRFQDLLAEIYSQCNDLLYFCDVATLAEHRQDVRKSF